MDDERTVGDQSKENSRANVHSTNNSGRAMQVDNSSGRRRIEAGTQEGDGDKRKVASTVEPDKANMQWNKKRKGDGWIAERGPNINEKNRINGRTMNIEKSGGTQKSENGSRERYGDERKTASKKKKKRKKGKGNLKRK